MSMPMEPYTGLTFEQYAALIEPVDPEYVVVSPYDGLSRIEPHRVKAELTRVFGFGGFDIRLVSWNNLKEFSGKHRNEEDQSNSEPVTMWTTVYQATIQLVIHPGGRELCRLDGAAIAGASKPSAAASHETALKTAQGRALCFAATPLGNRFGLSLYVDGSLDPLVTESLIRPAAPAGVEPGDGSDGTGE